MGACPFRDLKGTAGQGGAVTEFADKRTQFAKCVAGGRLGREGYMGGADLWIVQPHLLQGFGLQIKNRTDCGIGKVKALFLD